MLAASAKPPKLVNPITIKNKVAEHNFVEALTKDQLQRKTGEMRVAYASNYTTGTQMLGRNKKRGKPLNGDLPQI